jgi:small subunit ribosomal protein S10
MKKNKNQIKITICGYDVATIEEATRQVSERISQLKLTFKGPIPLPTDIEKITVPISPHKHKGAQEHFQKDTHKRVFFIASISPSALESLEKLKVPDAVHLECKLFF